MRALLVVACSLLPVAACTTTSYVGSLSRPSAARWLEERRGEPVVVYGRPGFQEWGYEGTLLGLAGNSLQLSTGDGQPVLLDTAGVRRIRHVDRGGGAWRGALIGASLGLLPAMLLGAVANLDCTDDYASCSTAEQLGNFALGTAMGLIIPTGFGALIGYLRGNNDELEIGDAEAPPR